MQQHGGDVYTAAEFLQLSEEQILDFSSNINPLGVARGVDKAMHSALSKVNVYPDPQSRKLKKSLSDFFSLPPDYFFCSNGAADVIFRFMQALQPKRVLLAEPCFLEYEMAARAAGCREISYYQLEEAEGFQLQGDFLAAITDVDLVVLCNPNNPTGVLIPTDLLASIAKQCQAEKIYLLLDECFQDFLAMADANSLVKALAANPYLVILQAFTKFYALPGLRLGYAISSNYELLLQMRACGQPWPVSVVAEAAGIAALLETGYANSTRELVQKEREFLRCGLQSLGYKVYEGRANYLFFACQQTDLEALLTAKKILIRSCSNYPSLDQHYYRVAVKNRNENVHLLQALEEVKKWEKD